MSSNEGTEVFIEVYDDNKGKPQSVEANIKVLISPPVFGHGSVQATSYGETEQEALDNLQKILIEHMRCLSSALLLGAMDHMPIRRKTRQESKKSLH